MTAHNGQDLFGLSPAPAPAADHMARVAEWKQGLACLAPARDPCPARDRPACAGFVRR